jgi:CheY-like chemotaxis protein
MNLLVVEDDDELRAALVELLVDEGHRVSDAKDGCDALAHLQSHRRLPDVILLDLWMHGMSGTEFLESQRADPRLCDIPVFVMSGSPVDDPSVDDLDVLAVFPKPLDPSALFAALDELAHEAPARSAPRLHSRPGGGARIRASPRPR